MIEAMIEKQLNGLSARATCFDKDPKVNAFLSSGLAFWGRLLPRNYFVVAEKP